MDRLVELYKTADEKNSWVRVPVINYLRACPLPKAKELLKECETIDPAAVKRANTFFPGTPAAPAPPADKASQAKPPASSAVAAGTESKPVASASGTLAMSSAPAPPADDNELIASALNQGVSQAAALRKTPPAPANLWVILGVPWL